jgi:hypothetical protein
LCDRSIAEYLGQLFSEVIAQPHAVFHAGFDRRLLTNLPMLANMVLTNATFGRALL